MASTFTTRMAAIAFGAMALLGAGTAAHASVSFTNLTGQPLKFTTSCAGAAGEDQWEIDPHSDGAISCRNGANSMQVTILTRRPSGPPVVVRGTVYDGNSYDLGYDDDGDVGIALR